MVLGYLLHKAKDWRLPTKFGKYVFNVTGWCLAIILAVSTLYGKYQTERKDDPQPFSRIQSISYGTFARFAWSLAIAWVIFACQRGLGGLVNRILSARFWILLSRLNYCAYLVHFVVLLNLLASNEFVWTYSDVHMAYRFVGVMSISYGVAFILSVCVEVPARQLEKLILKRNSWTVTSCKCSASVSIDYSPVISSIKKLGFHKNPVKFPLPPPKWVNKWLITKQNKKDKNTAFHDLSSARLHYFKIFRWIQGIIQCKSEYMYLQPNWEKILI